MLICSCVVLALTQVVIGFELSHQYSNVGLLDDSLFKYNNKSLDVAAGAGDDDDDDNNEASNSSDDLIYLATKPIDAITATDRDGDASASEMHCQRIDMADFIDLIPAKEVKSIVGSYYRNDREVQRAFTYLESKDFNHLKGRILSIPEVNAFLVYLNQSGFDVLSFMNALANLAGDPTVDHQTTTSVGDDKANITTPIKQNTTSENMNGLHGLVDSILDILPQDQVLSLFFDKLETSEEFSKFVENIGSKEFSQILQDMEDSKELRNLVFTLHNNGIYVARIVDSLKAYFFLGTF